jgi:hypothetical protein
LDAGPGASPPPSQRAGVRKPPKEETAGRKGSGGQFTLQNNSETINPQMNGSGAYIATAIDGRGAPGTYKGTFSGIVVAPKLVVEGTPVVTHYWDDRQLF